MLYEQKARAMAPATARMPFIPIDSISRKPPRSARKRYVAGLRPVRRNLYIFCVQSPSKSSMVAVVGIPPNMEFVHAVGSSGCAALWVIASLAIPFQDAISLWFTILPSSTCGTNPYASTTNSRTMPAYISIFFNVSLFIFISNISIREHA